MTSANHHVNHARELGRCRDWLKRRSPGLVWIGMVAGKFGGFGNPDAYVTGYPGSPRTFWLEMKTGRGQLTDKQTEKIQALRDAGDVVFVIHSLEELKEVLGISEVERIENVKRVSKDGKSLSR